MYDVLHFLLTSDKNFSYIDLAKKIKRSSGYPLAASIFLYYSDVDFYVLAGLLAEIF